MDYMMSWLDVKYINLLSPRLEQFKRKNSNLYNFRCPICGDSKDRRKTRGYVFQKKGDYRFHCHNCNTSLKFPYFLKRMDPVLYYEYIKESMFDKAPETKPEEKFTFQRPKFESNSSLKKLKKISQLKPEHVVKIYVNNRHIPSKFHYKLYLTREFNHWVNTMIPDMFTAESLERDEPRLVIPLLDREGNMFGFQGRSFRKNSKLRYITIMLEERPRIYGLDTVDTSKDIYCTEGPIDSMFIENGIATCGGEASVELVKAGIPRDKLIMVYDNEPRNEHTVKKIQNAIEQGFRVCIWPDAMEEKDINDMVLKGMNPLDIINNNVYDNLSAKVRLSQWKKL